MHVAKKTKTCESSKAPLHVIVDVGCISYWKLASLASTFKCTKLSTCKELILKCESENKFEQWIYEVKVEIVDIICKFNPDYLTLACDGSEVWRRDVYPEYKKNRKSQRSKIPIDWKLFYSVRDQLMLDFERNMPIVTMLLNKAEADDIVAVLTELLHESQNIIALSNDTDWCQLLKYKNFRQFKVSDNSKLAFLSTGSEGRTEFLGIDPIRLLQKKILMGDAGDNIPNIRPKLGEVSANNIIDSYSGNIYAYAEKENLLEAFDRNQILINLDRIPLEIKKSILDLYSSKKLSKVDNVELMDFLPIEYSSFSKLTTCKLFEFNAISH